MPGTWETVSFLHLASELFCWEVFPFGDGSQLGWLGAVRQAALQVGYGRENGNVGSWELQQVGLKQPVFAAAASSTLLRAEQSPWCCYQSRRGCELSVGARMPLLGPR